MNEQSRDRLAEMAMGIRDQRDDLLIALEGLAKIVFHNGFNAPGLAMAMSRAEAAIAKATTSTERSGI